MHHLDRLEIIIKIFCLSLDFESDLRHSSQTNVVSNLFYKMFIVISEMFVSLLRESSTYNFFLYDWMDWKNLSSQGQCYSHTPPLCVNVTTHSLLQNYYFLYYERKADNICILKNFHQKKHVC